MNMWISCVYIRHWYDRAPADVSENTWYMHFASEGTVLGMIVKSTWWCPKPCLFSIIDFYSLCLGALTVRCGCYVAWYRNRTHVLFSPFDSPSHVQILSVSDHHGMSFQSFFDLLQRVGEEKVRHVISTWNLNVAWGARRLHYVVDVLLYAKCSL